MTEERTIGFAEKFIEDKDLQEYAKTMTLAGATAGLHPGAYHTAMLTSGAVEISDKDKAEIIDAIAKLLDNNSASIRRDLYEKIEKIITNQLDNSITIASCVNELGNSIVNASHLADTRHTILNKVINNLDERVHQLSRLVMTRMDFTDRDIRRFFIGSIIFGGVNLLGLIVVIIKLYSH